MATNLGEFDYCVSYGMIAYGGELFIGTQGCQPAHEGYAPRMAGGVVSARAVSWSTTRLSRSCR